MPPSLVQRLDAIEDLPTVPHTMQAVLSGLDSVSASAEKLTDIIKQDPVLTAKVMKIANSPVYSGGVEISSLSRAIVGIGFEEVRNIVVGLSLSGMFCDDLGFEEFSAVDIWLHSIGVATCAKMIAEQVDDLEPEDLFTVGMLHDLGRLLYCLYFPDELRDVLANVSAEKSLSDAEMDYGLAHSEIGAYLAHRWNLGPFIMNSIRFHHDPRRAGDYSKPASAVYLADAIIMQLKFGWAGVGAAPKILVPQILGLEAPQVKAIAKKMQEQKDDILSGWSEVING